MYIYMTMYYAASLKFKLCFMSKLLDTSKAKILKGGI